ncbi:MAG: MBL fold metallo-hydrolase RNA specificity domain-containing protein [Lachnospiraceae bacterium]|nr:MBL fold metallo-hydrolase RNA specificity domain-containing protein [Lachnospiraceae bacterium]
MILEFLGAAREVTGSCHYLHFGDTHVLVDCGMEQGPDLYVNQEIPVNASLIDYVFVTHAHIDHSGLLPLLFRKGFRGKVYATKATSDLCQIMLLDSAHIQEFEAEWRNRKGRRAGKEEVTPMYSTEDAENVLARFVPCPYHQVIEVSPELKIQFLDAGHLLGSSCIEIWVTEGEEEKKLLFSGDIGHGNQELIRNPDKITTADYVVMESTYGDRLHEPAPDYALLLANEIRDTFRRGGNLVIPAFAVGRTQQMLYYMRRIKSENLLPEYPDFPVYIDSPLAVEATQIFNEHVQDCYPEKTLDMIRQGINPLKFDDLKICVDSADSKAINFVEEPKVIISASGMCEAGRIRHHLKHNLWRADSTVLFVGYQVAGTLGYNLLHGAEKVKLFGEEITVKAKIVNLPGISGHADREHLTDWLANLENKPERVFVVHGEEQTAVGFSDHIYEQFHYASCAPYSGDVWDLNTNECIVRGTPQKAEGRKKSSGSPVFDRLVAAGARLAAVITKCRGMANKDLAKFADQINALADKWDR